MKKTHKVLVGACSLFAVVGILVSSDIIYLDTATGTQTITNNTNNTSQANEAKTVAQEKDGHLTFK
jgi:hypothetical protein